LNGEFSNNNEVDWESGSIWEIDGLTAIDFINKVNRKLEGYTIAFTFCIDFFHPLGYNPIK